MTLDWKTIGNPNPNPNPYPNPNPNLDAPSHSDQEDGFIRESHLNISRFQEEFLKISRFQEEFVEISRRGRGGFQEEFFKISRRVFQDFKKREWRIIPSSVLGVSIFPPMRRFRVRGLILGSTHRVRYKHVTTKSQ